MADELPIYPMTREDWAGQIERALGLSMDDGTREYEADNFPHDELRDWMTREFASDGQFVTAVARNVKSLTAWIYGGAPEPIWNGSDVQIEAGSAPIIHVDIPVRSLARAREFYGQALGWRFGNDQEDESGRFVWFLRGQAVGGKLREKEGAQFADGVHIYCAVDDLEEALTAVAEGGGEVVSSVRRAGWGRYALIRDPDGTVLAVCGA